MNKELLLKSDEELCVLAQNNDEDARAILLGRNMPAISRIAGQFVNTGVAFDDLVCAGSNGLYKAINSYDKLKDTGGGFAAYLQVLVRHAISAMLKEEKKKAFTVSLDDDENLAKVAGFSSPETEYIDNESFNELLDEFKGALTELEFKVFRKFIENYSYREIGTAVGKSPKAVDNALQRAKIKIRNICNGDK